MNQEIKLLLNTGNVFQNELEDLVRYPKQWMEPYALYKTGYFDPKVVAVLITISEVNGAFKPESKIIEIELYHMGIDPKKRERHLSAKFITNAQTVEEFLKYSSFGTKTSIPKPGDITKLFRDSPYVLQKSVMVVLKYLQSKKLAKKSDFFENIWHSFELNKKATVPEFMKLVQQLLK